jgi:hypothetical protein
MTTLTDTERLLFQSLRFEAGSRGFGLRPGRERDIARHFYLLALEDVSRALDQQVPASPRHDVA